MLGGSSAINGLIYIRGQKADFDAWQRLGATGWGYDSVLPYFKKSECYRGSEGAFHSTTGELGVSDLRNDHPYCDAWLQAAQQAGYPHNPDFNGAQDSGVGPYQLTLKGHWRSSAADAFLYPILHRPNLSVLTQATVSRILFEGDRAIGVEWLLGGQTQRAHCDGEVLLSAGALQSPQVLQLSGIGPEAALKRAGVPVRLHAPGVGANLQDHYQARVIVRLRKRMSLNDDVRNPEARRSAYPLHSFSGFSASAAQCRPDSRGNVAITSADPLAPPRIDAGYFTAPHDMKVLVEGLKALRDIHAQPAFRDLVQGEHLPGPQVRTDADLAAFGARAGGTVFHATGTCRMGGDETSVLDPQLRVRGVRGLRVIDASAMPTMTSANTNAATIMIGEHGSALVLQDRAKPGAIAH